MKAFIHPNSKSINSSSRSFHSLANPKLGRWQISRSTHSLITEAAWLLRPPGAPFLISQPERPILWYVYNVIQRLHSCVCVATDPTSFYARFFTNKKCSSLINSTLALSERGDYNRFIVISRFGVNYAWKNAQLSADETASTLFLCFLYSKHRGKKAFKFFTKAVKWLDSPDIMKFEVFFINKF
jgi:hypothetical protein